MEGFVDVATLAQEIAQHEMQSTKDTIAAWQQRMKRKKKYSGKQNENFLHKSGAMVSLA